MKLILGRRGGALFLSLTMTCILAVLAAALARLLHSRIMIFDAGRNHDYGAVIADAAWAQTAACLLETEQLCTDGWTPENASQVYRDFPAGNRTLRATVTLGPVDIQALRAVTVSIAPL